MLINKLETIIGKHDCKCLNNVVVAEQDVN